MAHTEKCEILNRWTNAVMVTAEITCAPDASISVKLGLAQEVGGEFLDHNSDRPAERWFMMINPGDVPGKLGDDGKETGGAFAARKALEWATAWANAHGIDPDGAPAVVEQAA